MVRLTYLRVGKKRCETSVMRSGFMCRSSKSSSSAAPKPTSDWFQKAFETYHDPDENSIGPEGIEKLCKAMNVDPGDVKVLILAWLLRASQMGYFNRDEWMSGVPTLGVATSPESLLERLEAIEQATRRSTEKLRDLHNFTHVFCRTEGHKKVIAHQSAIHMLKLLHADAYPDHINRLCEFLEQHETSTKRKSAAALDPCAPLHMRLPSPHPDLSAPLRDDRRRVCRRMVNDPPVLQRGRTRLQQLPG